MKTVKRIFTCLLLFCLLCGLSACSKRTDTGSDWVWAYNQRGAFSDKGYYFLASGFLRFVDTTSGVSVCLCSKAGCLHDQEPDPRKSESCEARLIGSSMITPLFFCNDNLYYILRDQYGSHLYRRDATGANLETVATLGEKYIEDQRDVTVYAYAVADGFLYYSADVDGSVRTGDGGNMVQWISNYLGRLDLQTGKEEILLDKSDVYITLCAVKGNEALFHTAGIPDAAYDDPNYRRLRLEMPATLQHWDGTNGQVRTLLEKTVQEFPGVNIVDNDKLYYTSSLESASGVYTYDLHTNKLEAVQLDGLRHMGNGYALSWDADKEQWRLYDLNTKKELFNALNNEGFVVMTISNEGVVIKRTVEDHNAGDQQIYSYIKYASLADGLQEQDLMDFYSQSVTVEN